jgi:hypothetical protein
VWQHPARTERSPSGSNGQELLHPGSKRDPLLATVRGLQRHLRYLSGYLDFDDPPVARLTDFTNCQRPVLLLYGFFAARRTVEVLERRLRRDGYCVFSVNLGGMKTSVATRGIDDLAETVRVKVVRLYARNPALGPLTVIGHSQAAIDVL